MSDEKEYKLRYYFHGELACPNPREHYKYTRTYEQLRAEYDLLNCDKITNEDILEAYSKLARLKCLNF